MKDYFWVEQKKNWTHKRRTLINSLTSSTSSVCRLCRILATARARNFPTRYLLTAHSKSKRAIASSVGDACHEKKKHHTHKQQIKLPQKNEKVIRGLEGSFNVMKMWERCNLKCASIVFFFSKCCTTVHNLLWTIKSVTVQLVTVASCFTNYLSSAVFATRHSSLNNVGEVM